MPKTFFVTGLPRSGTAWMATFLSGCPGVTCVHEALRDLDRIEDLPAALPDEPFSGTADSGLPFFLEEVEAIFPDAPWVLLDRAEAASRASLTAFLGQEPPPGLYEALRAPLARIREKALVIPFEELTEREFAERLMTHIGYPRVRPGCIVPWSPWWRHMKDLRVSVRREAYENLKLDTPMVRKILDLVKKEAA